MKQKLLVGAISIIGLISMPVQAQDAIRFDVPIPPRLDKAPINLDKEIPDLLINPITIPVLEDQDTVVGPEYIIINSISFKGNTLVSDDQIKEKIAPYEGATILTAKIGEITNSINELYTQKAYEGSGAIFTRNIQINDNKIDLTLQIIEAKVSKITIEGTGKLNPYIRKQLSNLDGDFLNTQKIYNELRFLLEDERISKINLSTLNKPQLDQKEILLDVDTENFIQATLLINNGRSSSVGSFERGLSARHGNFAGLGDQLSVEYRNTEGSNIIGLSYDFPINSSGGELHLDYLSGNSKVIAEPLREFDIRSRTQNFSLSFSQPILRNSNDNQLQEFVLEIGASRTENKDTILNAPFPTTEGASEDGIIRSTRIDFSQSYSKRTKLNTLLLGSELSVGLGLGSTNDESFGNGEFIRWTATGLFSQRLNKKYSTLTNLNIQLSDRDLIGNEQFTLGGRGSVRGFLTNQLARTNGINLTQEFRFMAYDNNNHRIDLYGFFDFGTGWNDQPQTLEKTESLASIGIGVFYQFSDRIRFILEYGVPLFGPVSEGKSLQSDGMLLSLQFTF